jgi:hypothetical protein
MKKRTLQIDEDIDFQRREWKAQRFGVALLSLFVLSAALGLTGMSGPLNHGQVGEPTDDIDVEYDRVVRRGATANLTLHLRGHAAKEVQFWLSAPYLEALTVDRVVPQPVAESVERDRHVYTVHAGSREITIRLEAKHKTIGRIHGEIGLIGGASVSFTQWSLF